MSVAEIIQRIEELPSAERQQIIEFVHQIEDPERGLAMSIREADEGKLYDMETILSKLPPADL